MISIHSRTLVSYSIVKDRSAEKSRASMYACRRNKFRVTSLGELFCWIECLDLCSLYNMLRVSTCGPNPLKRKITMPS